jgi:hypothetical protein
MRADKVEICNIAIGYCGSTDWIQTIGDPDSTASLRCERFFDIAVEKVLSLHPWACATNYVQLAENTATPLAEYGKSFALPFDCVKIINCYEDDSGYCPYDRWRKHKRNIYTDMSAIYLKYVQYPEDYKQLDVLLSDAIAWELASMMAPTLVKSMELWNILNSAKNMACAKAKAMDTLESKELYTENNAWEDARDRIQGGRGDGLTRGV